MSSLSFCLLSGSLLAFYQSFCPLLYLLYFLYPENCLHLILYPYSITYVIPYHTKFFSWVSLHSYRFSGLILCLHVVLMILISNIVPFHLHHCPLPFSNSFVFFLGFTSLLHHLANTNCLICTHTCPNYHNNAFKNILFCNVHFPDLFCTFFPYILSTPQTIITSVVFCFVDKDLTSTSPFFRSRYHVKSSCSYQFSSSCFPPAFPPMPFIHSPFLAFLACPLPASHTDLAFYSYFLCFLFIYYCYIVMHFLKFSCSFCSTIGFCQLILFMYSFFLHYCVCLVLFSAYLIVLYCCSLTLLPPLSPLPPFISFSH
jgi:hypothetical protein